MIFKGDPEVRRHARYEHEKFARNVQSNIYLLNCKSAEKI